MTDSYLKFITNNGKEIIFREDITLINLCNFVNNTIEWEEGYFETNRCTLHYKLINFIPCRYIPLKDMYRLFGYDIEID